MEAKMNKECPYCWRQILAYVKRCPYCGKEIKDVIEKKENFFSKLFRRNK